MIEIGKAKNRKVRVRDKHSKKLVPKLGSDGIQETKLVADEVWRITRGALGHNYGSVERGRQLVVGMIQGDMLVIYPKKTRRVETASIFDIYAWMVRTRVNHAKAQKITKKAEKKRRQMALLRLRVQNSQ